MRRDEPQDIHKLCVAWGRWARCALPGADGTSQGYLRERIDHAHAGEPTPEIALTEQAAAKMRVERKDYWAAFARYYLNPTDLSEEEIADMLEMPLHRVTATLRQARILVGFHLHKLRNQEYPLRIAARHRA
jgi:hypothetical protein